MNEDKYLILDINLVPMIYKDVHGKIVKCFLNKPIDVFAYHDSNLFLTEREIRDYDERLLDFAYSFKRKGFLDYEIIKKSFS